MFSEGHNKLTIGSCCLEEYRRTLSHTAYDEYYPNLYTYRIDKDTFGSDTIGSYIRKAYRGGWCYLVKGKERRVFTNSTYQKKGNIPE